MGCQNANFVKISVSKPPRSRLEVFERESSVFLCCAPEASAAFRESATWGSDVELEAMESEQTGIALSLPLLPEHVCASLPVEFVHDYLYPSPEARDTVSFGIDDVRQRELNTFKHMAVLNCAKHTFNVKVRMKQKLCSYFILDVYLSET